MHNRKPISHPHAERLERRALLSTAGPPAPAGPATDASVAGRYIFFNHSAFDRLDPAANASDDAAVSPAIVPLLPGQSPLPANVSGYSRGINGVMVDVDHLPAGRTLAPDDFLLRVGNDTSNPDAWSPAPAASSVTVRRGAGAAGSDRITLVWPDGVIRNAWLQVTVRDTLDTGLPTPDVFYFASLPGDAGTQGALPLDITDAPDFTVAAGDFVATRRAVNRRWPVGLDNSLDHNRDGRVNARDLLVVKQNLLSRLERVQPSVPPPTYYVSPTGDDAANGRGPLSAWRTLSKVNATDLVPGAHVLFQRGGEWHDQLVASSSGTADVPVVFGSYGTGLKPKFWGSDPLDPAAFVPVGGADSTYRIVTSTPPAVNSIQADHAFFRSAYLAAGRPTDPAVALAVVKAVPRTWFQDPASGDLYVNTGGVDPRTGGVLYTASVRENVVLVQDRHDVVLRNLVVDESAKSTGGYAFAVGESSNVTVEGCEAYRAGKHHFGAIDADNFVGRELYSAWAMPDQGYGGASAYVSFSAYPFSNTRSTWSDVAYEELDAAAAPYLAFYTHGAGMGDLAVEDIYSRGGVGVSIRTDGRGQRVSVSGGLIENAPLTLYGTNTVVDGMTLRGPRAGVVFGGFGNVAQNVIIDGAKPDFGQYAAVVDYGHDNMLRFSTVRLDPATQFGAAVAITSGGGVGGAPMRLYANIIDAPATARFDSRLAVPMASDHNLFAQAPRFHLPDGSWMDLARWQAERGQDLNSIVGDPLFADAPAGDFSLLAASPAVDAFTPVDVLIGLPTDALGRPRPRGAAYDLGALERQA